MNITQLGRLNSARSTSFKNKLTPMSRYEFARQLQETNKMMDRSMRRRFGGDGYDDGIDKSLGLTPK